MEHVLARLGDRYDQRQLLDLGRYLTPFHLLPARWRRKAFFSGHSDSRAVICSGLIAQAFLAVHYPILPVLPPSTREEREEGIFPSGPRVRSTHPRLALPRDFDLSPYFCIVKFNSVEEGPIDYGSLQWEEAPAPPGRGRPKAGDPGLAGWPRLSYTGGRIRAVVWRLWMRAANVGCLSFCGRTADARLEAKAARRPVRS
jgi:hypothetical protein